MELSKFSNLVLVVKDGANHCGVFRSSHRVLFFSSSYTVLSTEALYFIISTSLWVAVLMSSGVDTCHVDW